MCISRLQSDGTEGSVVWVEICGYSSIWILTHLDLVQTFRTKFAKLRLRSCSIWSPVAAPSTPSLGTCGWVRVSAQGEARGPHRVVAWPTTLFCEKLPMILIHCTGSTNFRVIWTPAKAAIAYQSPCTKQNKCSQRVDGAIDKLEGRTSRPAFRHALRTMSQTHF